MDIPEINHSIWEHAVTKDKEYDLKFLATKILISRTRLQYIQNPNPETLMKCKSELRNLFTNYINNPKVQHDLKTLMQGGK